MKVLDLTTEKFGTQSESREDVIVAKSTQEILRKSLVDRDLDELNMLLKKFFPGASMDNDQPVVNSPEQEEEATNSLVVNDYMKQKVTDLRSTLDMHTGVILTGPAFSG